MRYSILINTCDKFEDCWEPFFKLFKIYWPDYVGKIYLNTEYKDFSYEGLDVIPLKVCEKEKDAHKITWSECLKRALEAIDSDVILYMQEDYFLKNQVKSDLVQKYADLMLENNDIHCIHLTDQAVLSDNDLPIKFEGLKTVKLGQRYRVSCQAALWKKDVLLAHIRTYESAWQFEEFGSQRSALMKHNFYVVDNNWVKLNEFEIIPYIFTGIVQGRWYEPVVDLFKNHQIVVDFSKRGLVKETPTRSLRVKIINRWKRIPFLYKNWTDLRKLK